LHTSSEKTLHARTKAFALDRPLQSWWCILSTAFLLVCTDAGTLPGLPIVVRVVCSVLTALVAVRLFVIYHDHQHRAILPKSKLAALFMRMYGILVLCPSTIWRSSHDHHHAHNSKLRGAHIGSYPIMTKEQYAKSTRGERFKYLLVRHPLTILLGYFSVFLCGMVIFPFVRSPRKHYDCLLSLLLHVALIIMLVKLFGWLAMILTLVLPLFIGSAIGSYLFYAQHNFPDVVFKDKAGWTYEGAAMESSCFLKTNPFMAWVTGNIGYHHVHHLNHRIPFYRLPEAHQAMPELHDVKTTSLHPRQILRCLRLKVWCVETQRMVGLPSH
jgi:omega-6 fatty acid desaturase (delta-12 desaturase)